MDWFGMDNQFVFEFIDYNFLDIELVRKRYGVVGQELPVELTITNNLFGFDGKLVHNYVEKKMNLETSRNINIKYDQGTNTYTLLDYPTTYIGDVDTTINFVLFILGKEFTIPISITDDYRVLAISPSSGNPIMVITSEGISIDDGDTISYDIIGEDEGIVDGTIIDTGIEDDAKQNRLWIALLIGLGIFIIWGFKNS